MERKFTLEHARQLALMRQFAIILEKKTTEICLSDDTGNCFRQIVSLLRGLLERLDELPDQCLPPLSARADCDDGYEKCNDGVCRAWCS
jgi:hypothetical protein